MADPIIDKALFPEFHGISLAAGSFIANLHVEELALDPTPLTVNRIWYNTTEKAFKYSHAKAGGAIEALTFKDAESFNSEFDRIIVACGLEANKEAATYGKYVKNIAARYIANAESITDSIDILDTELARVEDKTGNFITLPEAYGADGKLIEPGRKLTVIEYEKKIVDALGGLTIESKYVKNETANFLKDASVTSFNAADVRLDTQVKKVQDSSGLEIDGSYIVDSTAHYIKDATTLASADKILDGVAFNLQEELDATQTGAGLNEDGTYTSKPIDGTDPTKVGSAHYIGTADSLFKADDILDEELFRVETKTGQFNDLPKAYDDAGNLINPARKLTVVEFENKLATALGAIDEKSKYAPNAGTAYISEVTTFNAADVKLATELNRVETKTGNFDNLPIKTQPQPILDANGDPVLDAQGNPTSTPAVNLTVIEYEQKIVNALGGLSSTSAYVKNTTARYIKNANSFNEADVKLDQAVDAVEVRLGDYSKLLPILNELGVETGEFDTVINTIVSNYTTLDTKIDAVQERILGGITTETLDTIKELSAALKDNPKILEVIQTNLNDAVTAAKAELRGVVSSAYDTLAELETVVGDNTKLSPLTIEAKDAQGNIIYQTNPDTGAFILDAQGNKIAVLTIKYKDKLDPTGAVVYQKDPVTGEFVLDAGGNKIAVQVPVYESVIEHMLAGEAALDQRVTTVENQVNGKIGDLTTLGTNVKTTIVNSINDSVNYTTHVLSSLNNARYTWFTPNEAPAAASYEINHGLNSNFVNVQVWVARNNKWRNDIVAIEEQTTNSVKIYLSTAAKIKVIVQSLDDVPEYLTSRIPTSTTTVEVPSATTDAPTTP